MDNMACSILVEVIVCFIFIFGLLWFIFSPCFDRLFYYYYYLMNSMTRLILIEAGVCFVLIYILSWLIFSPYFDQFMAWLGTFI